MAHLETKGICVILNVGSGKRDAKSQPDSIRAAFASQGADIALKLITKGSRLKAEIQKAIDENYTTIVAAGGDGTICTVAETLTGRNILMGILPLGTFNYFARSLDVPMDMESAAKVIIAGHTMPLRIASVNDSVFLNNASLGAYPAILQAREDIYRRWGRSQIAAYWAVLKTLVTLRRRLRLRLNVDGNSRDVRSPLVFLVNNAYQLEQMKLEGADRIRAGEMAIYIAPDTNRMGLIRNAVAMGLGRAEVDRNFEFLSGKNIVIENLDRPRNSKRTIAKDGERERLAGPYKFRIIPNALQVLVPEQIDVDVR